MKNGKSDGLSLLRLGYKSTVASFLVFLITCAGGGRLSCHKQPYGEGCVMWQETEALNPTAWNELTLSALMWVTLEVNPLTQKKWKQKLGWLYDQSSSIHNSQMVEVTQVSINMNGWATVVYTHHGILFSHKKEGNSVTCYIGWMNLENIVPGEISHSQTSIVSFQLQELPRIVMFRDSSMIVAGGWWVG